MAKDGIDIDALADALQSEADAAWVKSWIERMMVIASISIALKGD